MCNFIKKVLHNFNKTTEMYQWCYKNIYPLNIAYFISLDNFIIHIRNHCKRHQIINYLKCKTKNCLLQSAITHHHNQFQYTYPRLQSSYLIDTFSIATVHIKTIFSSVDFLPVCIRYIISSFFLPLNDTLFYHFLIVSYGF